MAFLIIFTCLGGFAGAWLMYGDSGWVIGALLGFVTTKLLQLNTRFGRLERELRLLQGQVSLKAAAAVTAPAVAQAPAEKPVAMSNTAELEFDLPLEALAPLPPADVIQPAPQPSSAPQRPSPWESNNNISRNKPAVPAGPSSLNKAVELVHNFFTQGNPIVRLGMVIMFFGLSFLVKYAAGEGWFPLELRMAVVALIAIGLIALGWKTRLRAGDYGLVLQGGGIAALYLTLFAAAKLYSLMPTGVAFGLMLLIVVLGVALAVLQNAQVLALMATAGGFLAPILTSDNSGNYLGLFSFYLLLNIGILTIAWFKTWRLLNWVGFVFTFVITAAWGVLEYQPEFYTSTQPFLLAFFALYLIVSILFSLRQPPNLKGLVDGSLVFGLPIAAFGLQTALLKNTEYGLALSAVALAALYLLLARWLWGRYQTAQRVLIESFIALSLTFATLAIPLALDAQWTSATWALEGVGLIWVGLRQGRLLPRCAGYLLQLAAAVSLLSQGIDAGTTPIVSGDFIGLLLLAISALVIAYLLARFAEQARSGEKTFGAIALIAGWCWWLIAGVNELLAHSSDEYVFTRVLLFFAGSSLLVQWLSKKINWASLGNCAFWLLPLSLLWSAYSAGESIFYGAGFDAFAYSGWLALLVFALVQYRFLWRMRQHPKGALISAHHVISAWLLLGLVAAQLTFWQTELHWGETLRAVSWFGYLMLPLSALIYLTPKKHWPFEQYAADYKNLIPAPLLLISVLWFLRACASPGLTRELYIPLLNPLDLAQAAIVLLYAYAVKRNFVGLATLPRHLNLGVLGLIAFAWMNIVMLRALHHYDGIAYEPEALWNSPRVQMALSILWALCALVIMNLSRRLQQRQLWFVGAALLALIVIKLFTQDVGSSTLARIVSFLAVSGFMMLIGYLSPIPASVTLSTQELKKEDHPQ